MFYVMKINVFLIKDLSVWITKVISIKNSIIKRLMDEIEEAEEQYEYNLESYLSSLDSFIGIIKFICNNVVYMYNNDFGSLFV